MSELLVNITENPPGSRAAVVCVPHAGAGVALYTEWRTAFAAHLDLHVLRMPGREELVDEEPYESMDDAVEDLSAEIDEAALPPYVLYGHCSGGVIAYAVARELVRSGRSAPAALVLSSTPSPADAPRVLLHDAGSQELLNYLVSFSGLQPHDIPPELWEIVEPAVRADLDLAAHSGLAPGEPPLDMPVVLLHGSADELVTAEDCARWAQWTGAHVEVRTVPGAGHIMINTHGPDLARMVAQSAAAVAGTAGTAGSQPDDGPASSSAS